MEIDKSKLGIMSYGLETEKQLKEKYLGKKIVDVQYDYLSEGFYIFLDNGECVSLDI